MGMGIRQLAVVTCCVLLVAGHLVVVDDMGLADRFSGSPDVLLNIMNQALADSSLGSPVVVKPVTAPRPASPAASSVNRIPVPPPTPTSRPIPNTIRPRMPGPPSRRVNPITTPRAMQQRIPLQRPPVAQIPRRPLPPPPRPPGGSPLDQQNESAPSIPPPISTRFSTASAGAKESSSISIGEPLHFTGIPKSPPATKIRSHPQREVPRQIALPIPESPRADRGEIESYIKKHEDGIHNASIARKTFLDLKSQEARAEEDKNRRKLDNLINMYNGEKKKLLDAENDLNKAKQRLRDRKSVLDNECDVIKRLRNGIKRNSATTRLEELEISRLSKKLDEEKNKLSLLEDKERLLRDRLETLSKDRYSKRTSVDSEKNKMKLYASLVKGLERNLKSIKDDIKDVEEERAHQSGIQNKLEIEMEKLEDDNHLPMFLKYT